MRTKIFVLTLMFMFLLSSNVFAMEKLPAEVLNAFQARVNSFQNSMLEERRMTNHFDYLTEVDIFQSNDTGYKVFKIDQIKIFINRNIDLYDAIYTNDAWYIPVSDLLSYEVEKVDGVHKLVSSGVYDEKDAIPYETLERTAMEKGLIDFVYINEPGLHVHGLIGKTANGSQFLSFIKNDDLKLQKHEIKDGKELIDEINSKSNLGKVFFILLLICIVIGILMYKAFLWIIRWRR